MVLPDVPGWLTNEVARVADQYDVVPDRAFPAWALAYLYDLEMDDSFDKTETLVVGDGGVDGWHYDDQAQQLVLLQAKWPESLESKTYGADDLDALVRAFGVLSAGSASVVDMDNRLSDIQADLQTARQNGAGVTLAFITGGRITDEAKEALALSAQGIGSCTVEFYDLPRFSSIRGSEQIISDLRGEQIAFGAQAGTSISELKVLVGGQDVRAAVVTLDGRALGDTIQAWSPQIFRSNVRYSLGRRNKVNQGIRETIRTPDQQGAFWLYNNGLTIVCDRLEVDVKSGALTATNPQVVNGAQTSSALAELRASIAPGQVSVLARFIEIDPQRDGADDLARLISDRTNSQSPVNAADLRSNEPRHTQLQNMFASLSSPFFYERRRGEWDALSPAFKARFATQRPRTNRVVSKEDVGQRLRAYIGEPAQSISKKNEIFETRQIESKVFDTNRSAELYLLAYELFASALKFMQKRNASDLKTLIPGWFDGDEETSQLMALRKAPRYVAAYATALASEALTWRYSNIGPVRASKLREVLAYGTPAATEFWRVIFKAIFAWSSGQEAATLKSTLASDATFPKVLPFLRNELAGMGKEDLLPSISGGSAS